MRQEVQRASHKQTRVPQAFHQARAFSGPGLFPADRGGRIRAHFARVLRRRADRGHPPGDVLRHLRRVRHGPVHRGRGRGAVLLRAGGAAHAHSGGRAGLHGLRHADHGGAGPAHLAAGPHDPARRHEPGGAQRHGAAHACVFPDRAGGGAVRRAAAHDAPHPALRARARRVAEPVHIGERVLQRGV